MDTGCNISQLNYSLIHLSTLIGISDIILTSENTIQMSVPGRVIATFYIKGVLYSQQVHLVEQLVCNLLLGNVSLFQHKAIMEDIVLPPRTMQQILPNTDQESKNKLYYLFNMREDLIKQKGIHVAATTTHRPIRLEIPTNLFQKGLLRLLQFKILLSHSLSLLLLKDCWRDT